VGLRPHIEAVTLVDPPRLFAEEGTCYGALSGDTGGAACRIRCCAFVAVFGQDHCADLSDFRAANR